MSDLTDTEIVDRINRALSLTTVNIATDPTNQPQYLSEFATTANDLLSRRLPKCTCAGIGSGWNPLGHSHGCPMREHLEKYGPPRK
jgi:hypothetical protein